MDADIKDTSEACPICFPLKMKNTEKEKDFHPYFKQLESINLTLNYMAELNSILNSMK